MRLNNSNEKKVYYHVRTRTDTKDSCTFTEEKGKEITSLRDREPLIDLLDNQKQSYRCIQTERHKGRNKNTFTYTQEDMMNGMMMMNGVIITQQVKSLISLTIKHTHTHAHTLTHTHS